MMQFLTYGILDGELKHVDEVPNGKKCNCKCPGCNDSLIAKNNPANIKSSHFAHESGSDCPHGYETALHLLAKKVLFETKCLRLPDFHHDYDPYNGNSLFRKGEEFRFDDVKLESVPLGAINREIIADAIAFSGDNILLVEFHNTHAIDDIKRKKIEKIGLTCVEITLANQTLSYDGLRSFFLSASKDVRWIHNPGLEKIYKDHKAAARQEAKERKAKSEKRTETETQRPLSIQENPVVGNFQPVPISSEYIYEQYKQTGKFKFYTTKGGIASKCPIKMDALANLASKPFYQHAVAKRIIDGEYWNGTIYDNHRTGECFIYLGGKRYDIYIAYQLRGMLDDYQKRDAALFYAAVKSLEEINNGSPMCSRCNFMKDRVFARGFDMIVCQYENLRDNDFVIVE